MMPAHADSPPAPDGFSKVPAGRIATVVTHLEMYKKPAPRAAFGVASLALEHAADPELGWYRALYADVGRDWLWWSRLQMSDDELGAILGDQDVEIYALGDGDRRCGLLELDFRVAGACELAFFGVTRSHVGTGAGRYLMNCAVELAFERAISLFHVHTCTLDHPAALHFYLRSGFVPVRQEIEIAPDPRIAGILPRSAAPHIPIFDDSGSVPAAATGRKAPE